MMRIGIVVDDFSGGAGNIAQLLAMRLRDSGNTVGMLLTHPHSAPRYPLDDITVHAKDFTTFQGNNAKKLSEMLKTTRYYLVDVMNCELVISFLDNNNSTVCLALWSHKIPIIVCERSNPLSIYPKFPWNHIRRVAYQRADAVTVQFKEFCGFDNGRFKNKCYVTPNFVRKPGYVKEDYESGLIRFAAVCRLNKVKRLGLMIELFCMALEQNRDIELYIFGEGAERERLERLIAENHAEDKIFLMGAIHNVHEELAKCDVYLMTSLQEGFPNSLCEALSVGLPAVCFECHSGIAELLNDGEFGFSIHEGDKHSFVDAMLELASNEEKRCEMGRKAKQIVETYDQDQVFRKWEQCIETVMERKLNRKI